MYLICDIDGTLSTVPTDRQAAAAAGNWDAFYRLDFTNDRPKQPVVNIVEAWLEAGGVAIFVTSRRASVRLQTEGWLREHLPSMNDRNSQLVMRDHDDATGEAEWKCRAVQDLIPCATAALVIDDHPAVCSRLAELGYQVLEVK